MEFEELIKETINILKTESNKNKEFSERYSAMIIYLENLKLAYKTEKLNKNNICLSIVRMLDHGDSQKLQEYVSKVNHYYQENIFEE